MEGRKGNHLQKRKSRGSESRYFTGYIESIRRKE